MHTEPDILDAATVWHVLGIIKTHRLDMREVDSVWYSCECGWVGEEQDYYEHLDDAVFYTLRDMDNKV